MARLTSSQLDTRRRAQLSSTQSTAKRESVASSLNKSSSSRSSSSSSGRLSDSSNVNSTATSLDPNGDIPPSDYDYSGIEPRTTGGSSSGYNFNTSYYEKALKEQQRAIQARIDAAVKANNAYIPQVNQQSDQALQNAYILREQNKINAPQALSALGYTGGATETGLMGINANYENSRNQIEQGRQQTLNDIYQNEQQIRATGDATLSEAAASYYDKLIAAQQQAAANAQAQSNWQANYDLQLKQYEDAAAQQAWQNAYDERLLSQKLNNTSASTGGSGGGSAGGSTATRDKNTSGNYNVVLNNVKRALGGSNAGSQTSWNAAINYIQNSLKQGLITEYEAMQMINTLGLN